MLPKLIRNAAEMLKKVFSKKTVKPITDFDAKHQKGGGFRGNTFSADTNHLNLCGYGAPFPFFHYIQDMKPASFYGGDNLLLLLNEDP